MDIREINRYLHEFTEDTNAQHLTEAAQEQKKWEDYDTIRCTDGEIIDMQKLLREQAMAEAACRRLFPHFGGLITKLRVIYTFKVETQATDGTNLFVNPQFTSKLTMNQKIAVMMHEVMHCLMNHLRRMRERDHYKSNIAADYEVNGTLTAMEPEVLPADVWKNMGAKGANGFYDKKYEGWGFEAIYDDISVGNNGSMDNSQQGQGQGQGQQGQGQGQSGSSSNQDDYSKKSDEYKAGWEAAVKAYNEGKLKL